MKHRHVRCLIGAAALITTALCGLTQVATAAPVVNIEWWSYSPNSQSVVNAFNKSHPGIHVSVYIAGGNVQEPKLFTDLKAGDAPDIAQANIDALPSFAETGDILNLLNYGAGKYKKLFTNAGWKLGFVGSGLYAIPQGLAPSALYYNKAAFAKYGLTVPKTWAQYAQEAISLTKAHPGIYLANFDPTPTYYADFVWQTGGEWYKVKGDSWQLGFTSASSEMVANYWQNLLNHHAASELTETTTPWYHALSKGTLLTWPNPQWGEGVLESDVTSGKGQWAIAPLPQWKAGGHAFTEYTPSTQMITKDSKHVQDDLTFLIWLATSKQGLDVGGSSQGWPVAASASASSQPWMHQALSYFGGENPFAIFNESAKDTVGGWSFGPDFTSVTAEMDDTFSSLFSGGTTLPKIMAKIQSEQLSTLKSQGISATG